MVEKDREQREAGTPIQRAQPDFPGAPTNRDRNREAGNPGAERHALPEERRTIELREERLIGHKDVRQIGEIVIHKEVEQVPGKLAVDAYREEVDVEHVPVGRVVSERATPWWEDGTLVVPVYEEQLVAVKRLMLREYLRVRRVPTTVRQVFEETLRRERVAIEDPDHTGRVHESYATSPEPERHDEGERREDSAGGNGDEHEGFVERIVRKVLL